MIYNSSFQSYSWSLILYENIDDILAVLNGAECFRFRHYAMILHDKDIANIDDFSEDIDGVINDNVNVSDEVSLKRSHVHLLLTFKQRISLKMISTIFQFQSNIFGKPIKNRYRAFLYLTHKNYPDRYQYSDSDIISNDISFWGSLDNKIDQNAIFMEDLLSLNDYEMALKYGRDYMKNLEKYRLFKLQLEYLNIKPDICYAKGDDNDL